MLAGAILFASVHADGSDSIRVSACWRERFDPCQCMLAGATKPITVLRSKAAETASERVTDFVIDDFSKPRMRDWLDFVG
jgi:hypothetical protein